MRRLFAGQAVAALRSPTTAYDPLLTLGVSVIALQKNAHCCLSSPSVPSSLALFVCSFSSLSLFCLRSRQGWQDREGGVYLDFSSCNNGF